MLGSVFNPNALGLTSARPIYYTGSAFASMLAVTYAASGTIVAIASGSTGDIPLQVTGFSGQTGNLQQWRDSTPTVVAAVLPGGGIYANGGYNESTTTAGSYIGVAGGTQRMMLANGTAAQNFQIDNTGAGFRFLYPGVVLVQFRTDKNPKQTIALDDMCVGFDDVANSIARFVVRSNDTARPVIATQQDFTGTATKPHQLLYKTSSTSKREAFAIDTVWVDSTDATRKARAIMTVYDTASREVMRGEASGSAPMLGFYGATAVVKPATTGTTTGFTAGTGTGVKDDSTFTGGTGATAYRISDIVLALKQLGLLTA